MDKTATEVLGEALEELADVDCIDDDPAHKTISEELIKRLRAAGYEIVKTKA